MIGQTQHSMNNYRGAYIGYFNATLLIGTVFTARLKIIRLQVAYRRSEQDGGRRWLLATLPRVET